MATGAFLFAELVGYASGISHVMSEHPCRRALITSRRVHLYDPTSIYSIRSHKYKRRLADFLRDNPYPNPYTEGLFYREKMRAIHRIAPDVPMKRILEVGGGRSGLTSLLYPDAQIVNIDLNGEYASAPCNQRPVVRFVCGDATNFHSKLKVLMLLRCLICWNMYPTTARRCWKHFASCAPADFCWSARPTKTGDFPITDL